MRPIERGVHCRTHRRDVDDGRGLARCVIADSYFVGGIVGLYVQSGETGYFYGYWVVYVYRTFVVRSF